MAKISGIFTLRRPNIKAYNIILASSSPFRKELLERLQIKFSCESPDIDEQQLPNEAVNDYVVRLSEEKARRVASNHPDAIIIASDQSVACNDEILGKPGNHENAKKQLMAMSGQTLTFYTGLCVLNTITGKAESTVINYSVSFRNLNESEIEDYLIKEQPYQCAGSFMSEKLGVSLLSKMEGDDPTALIGLPLIKLCEILRNQGIQIP